ncbi:MAG TPA: AMP-binding protein [Thermodesulfobacteriota bacterium]
MTAFYDPGEAAPPAERAAREAAALRALVAHAVANAPAARRLFERAGVDPSSIRERGDLAALPITRKEDLPELQRAEPPLGGWQGMPIEQYRYLFLSPGPIMEPAAGPGYWRTARAFFAAGFRAGDIVLNTFAYHLTPAGHMGDDGVHPLGGIVIPGGVGNTETQARLLEQAGVTGFFGIPSFLVAILEKAEELGIGRERRRLSRALVSGEMFPESLRARLRDEFGVEAYQAYLTADLGLVAFECAVRQGMHIADDILVEVVDLETGRPVPEGEVGQVVATAIGAPAYPLIRFGTGDLSVVSHAPCPCGRTSSRLVRMAGRVGDAVKVRGLFVHAKEADGVVAEFPAVARYRLVVTRKGHQDILTCEIETRGPVDEQALAARLRDVLKLRVDAVVVVPPGTFPERYKRLDDRRVWS